MTLTSTVADGIVAEAAKNEDPKRYKWWQYKGKRVIRVTAKDKRVGTFTKGVLFGVRNLNDRIDRVILSTMPDCVFSMKVELVSDMIDDSVKHREEIKFEEKAKKIKAPKPTKIVKEPKPVKTKGPTKIKISLVEEPKSLAVPKAHKPPEDRGLLDLDDDDYSDVTFLRGGLHDD